MPGNVETDKDAKVEAQGEKDANNKQDEKDAIKLYLGFVNNKLKLHYIDMTTMAPSTPPADDAAVDMANGDDKADGAVDMADGAVDMAKGDDKADGPVNMAKGDDKADGAVDMANGDDKADGVVNMAKGDDKADGAGAVDIAKVDNKADGAVNTAKGDDKADGAVDMANGDDKADGAVNKARDDDTGDDEAKKAKKKKKKRKDNGKCEKMRRRDAGEEPAASGSNDKVAVKVRKNTGNIKVTLDVGNKGGGAVDMAKGDDKDVKAQTPPPTHKTTIPSRVREPSRAPTPERSPKKQKVLTKQELAIELNKDFPLDRGHLFTRLPTSWRWLIEVSKSQQGSAA